MKALTQQQKKILLVLNEGIYGPDQSIGNLTEDQLDRLIGCADYICRIAQSRLRWRILALMFAAAFLFMIFVHNFQK